MEFGRGNFRALAAVLILGLPVPGWATPWCRDLLLDRGKARVIMNELSVGDRALAREPAILSIRSFRTMTSHDAIMVLGDLDPETRYQEEQARELDGIPATRLWGATAEARVDEIHLLAREQGSSTFHLATVETESGTRFIVRFLEPIGTGLRLPAVILTRGGRYLVELDPMRIHSVALSHQAILDRQLAQARSTARGDLLRGGETDWTPLLRSRDLRLLRAMLRELLGSFVGVMTRDGNYHTGLLRDSRPEQVALYRGLVSHAPAVTLLPMNDVVGVAGMVGRLLPPIRLGAEFEAPRAEDPFFYGARARATPPYREPGRLVSEDLAGMRGTDPAEPGELVTVELTSGNLATGMFVRSSPSLTLIGRDLSGRPHFFEVSQSLVRRLSSGWVKERFVWPGSEVLYHANGSDRWERYHVLACNDDGSVWIERSQADGTSTMFVIPVESLSPVTPEFRAFSEAYSTESNVAIRSASLNISGLIRFQVSHVAVLREGPLLQLEFGVHESDFQNLARYRQLSTSRLTATLEDVSFEQAMRIPQEAYERLIPRFGHLRLSMRVRPSQRRGVVIEFATTEADAQDLLIELRTRVPSFERARFD